MNNSPKIKKKTIAVIALVTSFVLVAGVVLDRWSEKEMRKLLKQQFNSEQLVIARNIKNLIERELNLLTREISLVSKEIKDSASDPERLPVEVQKSLSRVLKSGVIRIEIIDMDTAETCIFIPHGHWSGKVKLDHELGAFLKSLKVPDNESVWVSQPRINPSGISLLVGKTLSEDASRLIIFDVNISWFLAPFLKNIRSGETGYAWIIDQNGYFLFHPDSDLIGKSAFSGREEKQSSVSYKKINFIQKEKMLQGFEGSGSYVTGWHRGITGQIEKLVSFCPIMISDHPPQKWSVAVVAPVSEIEKHVKARQIWRFLAQGMMITIIILATLIVLFSEMRWSRVLENKVNKRTADLKKSEEKYRSLVESAEDFIFTLDLEGHFQSMNRYTAIFFGGRPEEFIGKNFASLVPGSPSKKHLKAFRLVCNYGKSLREEFRFQIGNHKIWISANFMPIKDEKGKVNSVLCIARDITEAKNMEMQLVNTEKLASLGTLAAGVAHEINNPLGVMLGFCELLIRKKEAGTQEFEDLKTIERQGLLCKEIVENLLSFARPGNGVLKYSDLNQSLDEISNIVKHNLEMNNIELVVEPGPDIPRVKGDPRELQQVFLNLTNNAISAMKDGGLLTIRTWFDHRTRKAFVQFKDNGIGIDEENLSHIYEPFFTTKPEGQGTGLGLFVSYGIITRQGGSIECISRTAGPFDQPGETIFTVKMPTREE